MLNPKAAYWLLIFTLNVLSNLSNFQLVSIGHEIKGILRLPFVAKVNYHLCAPFVTQLLVFQTIDEI